jgi:hypothetical protein
MGLQKDITGGCFCGSIRFAIVGSLASAAYCHCTDCRKCTGSAFNVSVPVDCENFKLLSGKPKGFTKTAASGNKLTRKFLPRMWIADLYIVATPSRSRLRQSGIV